MVCFADDEMTGSVNEGNMRDKAVEEIFPEIPDNWETISAGSGTATHE